VGFLMAFGSVMLVAPCEDSKAHGNGRNLGEFSLQREWFLVGDSKERAPRALDRWRLCCNVSGSP